ncbi:hypothetical protein I5W12_21315 [Stenotrophomonas maltophilia]|uniref:hypothetical protein n=1 Tax=Stenotrophomonas maltophilia TaxID=40324 RepID=UPI0006AA3CA6|nr:hypothetical protein [Stenotrophomonas maltophilia]MBH1479946.1 hypothetical protein [Stenotrophomonas maltophilia]MBH1788123.1 hypothetical protein [Stenotrophomonas maltophilia]
MFLKGQPLDMPALQQVLAQAQQLPLPRRPAVRLSTADDTHYQDMARVLLAVSQRGLRVEALGRPWRHWQRRLDGRRLISAHAVAAGICAAHGEQYRPVLICRHLT